MKTRVFGALLLVGALALVYADTPANCTFDDVMGDWMLYETERSGKADIDCDDMGPLVHKTNVSLLYPNIAVDEYANRGTWTMIYNQGFEIKVAGRSYFAFSMYQKTGTKVVSYCGKTLSGWSRDVTVRNWACYRAVKATPVDPKVEVLPLRDTLMSQSYKYNKQFVSQINELQDSWVATVYPHYEEKTLHDHTRRNGGKASSFLGLARAASSNVMRRLQDAMLPQAWDWRNVSGVNYVSPVRSQGNCGSCYAFASMAALESRVRILTNNEQKPVFSPQDIVGCTKLAQGCDGGFPYLIAGRYGQDQGAVLEECSPYEGKNDVCRTDSNCLRHYVSNYRYVGGYYGACNEMEMKAALVKGGPVVIGFEVYPDFMHYKGGVYHYTGLTDKFNPLELTNHAVTLVGYGVDDVTGEKFWTVKNSWGTQWGEDGFFRIRRGNDECAIESMAVEIIPIP